MVAPSILPDSEIKAQLNTLRGWQREGTEIVKSIEFPEYLDGLEFVYQLGKVADDNDHHPDIYLGYKKVTVRLGTHSVGGITELDFKMARNVDGILKEFQTSGVSDA